jgi:hypothetical protein
MQQVTKVQQDQVMISNHLNGRVQRVCNPVCCTMTHARTLPLTTGRHHTSRRLGAPLSVGNNLAHLASLLDACLLVEDNTQPHNMSGVT